jgi:hypothetical protein
MPTYISPNVAEAVAKDVFEDSRRLDTRDLEPGESIYQISGSEVRVSSAYEGGGGSLAEYDLSVFFGGVTYALAERGDISVEEASPVNVAKVCIFLGQLVERGGLEG